MRWITTFAAVAGLLLVPVAANASTATLAEGAGHLRIVVPSPSLSQGHIVSLGDWNGDGLPDVAVSDTTGGPAGQGAVWIVYGKASQTTVDLSGGSLPAGAGVTILGPAAASFFGQSLAAGDINGDGRPDLVVGAPAYLGSVASSVWVVFAGVGSGSSALTSGTLDLSAGAGTHGYKIAGPAATGDLDQFGQAVAVVPDMNGDGRAEVAAGAPAFTNAGRTADGGAFVAFGQSTSSNEAAATLSGNDQGFEVLGAAAHDALGTSISAGDFTGDGRGDVLIGAPNGHGGTGSAYVAFGKAGTANLDLALAPGPTSMFVPILGSSSGDEAGQAVAIVPDMNGDGRSEAVVCAPFASINGLTGTGECTVVFGRATYGSLSLATIGTSGFAINGAVGGGIFGTSAASAGDVNGDGRGDLVIGSSNETAGPDGSPALSDAGLIVVVLGQGEPLPLSVDDLGAHGYAIAGTALNQQSGAQVAAIGDVDGDGRSDLLIGSNGVGGRFFDEYTARPLPTAGAATASAATTSTLQISVPVTVLGAAPTAVSLQLTPAGGSASTIALGTLSASGTLGASLSGLAAGTSYSLQVSVSNVFGSTAGPPSSASTIAITGAPGPPPVPPPAPPSTDTTAPRSALTLPTCAHLKAKACMKKRTGRAAWKTLHGTASDAGSGASGVKTVSVSLVHALGKGRCIAYQAGKLHTTTCAKARALTTHAALRGNAWSLAISPKLALGSWSVVVRAVDAAGNSQSTPATASFRLTH